MKRLYLRIVIPILAAILGFSAALAADKPVDVRDIMTANQFRNAGLDKLSADQIASLNADVKNISTLAAANKTVDLESILTADQFRGAGLNTLSPDQMATLNGWVTTYLRSQGAASVIPPSSLVPETPAPTQATGPAAFGATMLKSTADEPDSIHSTIVGKFTGWSGSTIFKLANGQIWQQSSPADYETQMQNPEVIIKKLRFGYLLTLPGRGQTVFVMRIR
jgi:hypothetical protein